MIRLSDTQVQEAWKDFSITPRGEDYVQSIYAKMRLLMSLRTYKKTQTSLLILELT